MHLAMKMFVYEGKSVESTVYSAMMIIALLIHMVLKSMIMCTLNQNQMVVVAILRLKPQPFG
jgi:hypothetical protein